jgi:hypothetical protein
MDTQCQQFTTKFLSAEKSRQVDKAPEAGICIFPCAYPYVLCIFEYHTDTCHAVSVPCVSYVSQLVNQAQCCSDSFSRLERHVDQRKCSEKRRAEISVILYPKYLVADVEF